MSAMQMLQPAFSVSNGIASRFRPMLRVAGQGVAVGWRVLTTRRELLEMDERMLKDIGISRAQANFEANRWFWQVPKV